jgi:hypothetical protein
MSQVFPDTPGVIYRLLDADPEFLSYIGSYKFSDGQVRNAISTLTPGANIPGVQEVTGVECIIHDISNVRRIDYLTDSSTLINEWKVFLVAWDPATGEDVNNAARRIMDLFRGATSTQTVKASEGLNARVQTVVTIPSNRPLDIDGMAIYGPQPVVEITTSQNYIQPGEEITLSWIASSAIRAEMNNDVGNIALSGSQTFVIDRTTVFTITAYNDFTTGSGGIEIIVLDPTIAVFDYEQIGTTSNYRVYWAVANAQEVRFNGRYDWPASGETILEGIVTATEFALEAWSTQGSEKATITIPGFPTIG